MIDPMIQHGAFSWNELLTTDTEGAKKFYAKLFGWKLEDNTQGMPYTMAKIDNTEAAGIMAIPPENAGMRAAWGGYVTVDDVDDSARKVVALGGSVLIEATDIPNVGRFVVIADPQGATLSLITYIAKD